MVDNMICGSYNVSNQARDMNSILHEIERSVSGLVHGFVAVTGNWTWSVVILRK